MDVWRDEYMMGQTYELYELQSAVLEHELAREVLPPSLAHLSYSKQKQMVAMVLTPRFVSILEHTPSYAAYFDTLVHEWRKRRAEQTP